MTLAVEDADWQLIVVAEVKLASAKLSILALRYVDNSFDTA